MASSGLDPRAEKAFAFAQETTKQVITLSTGVLALTLTFVKDIAPPTTARTLLEIAWVVYVVAVIGGVATLMALTGNVERPHSPEHDSIYSPNIKIMAVVQIGAFVAALGFTVAFGFKAT